MKIHRLLAVLLLSSLSFAQIDTGAGGGGGGSGTVTSVAATVPSGLAVAGTPVTTAGTLAITWSSAADQILLSTASNTAGFATLPTCSAATSALSYNVTTHAFGCNTIGAPALETVGNPGANKAFTMGANTLNFNFSGNWGAGFGYSITSSGSNAATGPLFQLSSGSATTHDVFQACALGTSNCVKLTSAGLFTTIGTATIDATKLLGNLPALNGSALTNLPAGTPSYPVTVAGTVTSGGIPYFSATTTETSSALLTSNSPVLGGGAGAAPKTATFLTTNGTSELDIGVAGASGILGLKGTTSGTATLTAPAIAGTSTNGVTASNVWLGPEGTAGAPTYSFSAHATSGFYSNLGALIFAFGGNNVTGFNWSYNGELKVVSGGGLAWADNTTNIVSGSSQTGLTSPAAAVVAVGSGAAGDTTGKLKAAAYMSIGTTFTTDTGCGTVTSKTGGATAGTFVAQATGACTVVITMGNTSTAPNGWSCYVNDRTTANLFRQTASSTTTATISGTAVTSDVINFGCMGY